MTFIDEYPVSEQILNRFDWTALPLLYQGELGGRCMTPQSVLIDYDNDLISYLGGGGGFGRTTGFFQPPTYVLYFKGVPIRFVYSSTDSKKHKDENTGLFIFDWIEFSINRIVSPGKLKTQEPAILHALEKVCEAAAFNSTFARPKSVSVKITCRVEYI